MCHFVVLTHLYIEPLLRLELFFGKLQKHCLSFPSFNDLKSLVFFFLRQDIDRIYESKEHDQMLFFNITDELKYLWLFGFICEVLRMYNLLTYPREKVNNIFIM